MNGQRFFVAVCVLVCCSGMVHAQVGKVFWSGGDLGAAYIRTADLDGSNAQTIVTGLESALGIEIDPVNQHVYWVGGNDATSHIKRADWDGTNIIDILQPTFTPTGISLDLANSRMYWTEWNGPNSALRSADLDGSNLQTLSTGNIFWAVEVDPVGGKVYWSNFDTLWRADVDGTNQQIVYSDANANINGVSIDPVANQVYWTNAFSPNAILRADLDGGNVQTLPVPAQDTPLGIDAYYVKSHSQAWWVAKGVGNNAGWLAHADQQGNAYAALLPGEHKPSDIAVWIVPAPGTLGLMALGFVLVSRRRG